jgi:hypothetical protein
MWPSSYRSFHYGVITQSHIIYWIYGYYLAKGTGDAGRPLLEDGTSRAFCKDPCKMLKKTWKLMQLNLKTLEQACAKKPHQTHATCKPRQSRRWLMVFYQNCQLAPQWQL